ARVRAGARSQRARAAAGHSRGRFGEAAVGRASSRPEGQRFAAGLRRARPTARGLRRRRCVDRRPRCCGARSRAGATGRAARRPQRVQAASGAARRTRLIESVREGPAASDHEPLARLTSRRTEVRWRAQGGLVLAALFFGVTFPLVHDSLQDIEPFAYVTLRFVTAVVVLSPFALRIARRDGTDVRALLRVGLIAGVLLAGGYATQTIGLKTATPSASAFITGLYVVITPVIESVVGRVTLQWPV